MNGRIVSLNFPINRAHSFHNFTTPLPSLLIIFFLLPLSTRSFFFRKCFHENERERARQGAARKEEHERESGLKKLVQIK
jgi:hypothetical protein